MKKLLQFLFFFEKYEIKTTLSKMQILQNVVTYANPRHSDFVCGISTDKFMIVEKQENPQRYTSFPCFLKAKMTESDGITSVSIVIKMPLFLQIVLSFFVCLGIASLLFIFLIPLHFLLHSSFKKATKKLKNITHNLLMEKGMDESCV